MHREERFAALFGILLAVHTPPLSSSSPFFTRVFPVSCVFLVKSLLPVYLHRRGAPCLKPTNPPLISQGHSAIG